MLAYGDDAPAIAVGVVALGCVLGAGCYWVNNAAECAGVCWRVAACCTQLQANTL